MAEIDVGGIKFTGGKMFAVLTALSSAAGIVWGAALFWNDYESLKAKLESLDPGAIQTTVDQVEIKLDEAISYTKDVKGDLRSDLIAMDKVVNQTQREMREIEIEYRNEIKEAQRWFDERTAVIDRNQKEMEANLKKQIRDALTNALAEDR
jgi:hypothetical protein